MSFIISLRVKLSGVCSACGVYDGVDRRKKNCYPHCVGLQHSRGFCWHLQFTSKSGSGFQPFNEQTVCVLPRLILIVLRANVDFHVGTGMMVIF